MTREEFKRIVEGLREDFKTSDVMVEFCDMAISALSEEHSTTEWVDDKENVFACHCKECGQEILRVQYWFKFCPNCGRKVIE